MRELDGSAAGGQFLRTALALAALRTEPVRIENVRGDRPNPGLAHQHLAVVETLSAICDADVEGAELGAETVTFEPGGVEGGSYRVDVGTAGSVTLLFDAVLPLAIRLDDPLSVTATGGTDVAWSPPADYYRHVKLPTCRQLGLRADLDVERRGFYPAGGGRATLSLEPSTLEPVAIAAAGGPATGDGGVDGSGPDVDGSDPEVDGSPPEPDGVRLYSVESESLADQEVARRQAEGALERLDPEGRGLAVRERVERTVVSESPGSAIVLRLDRPGGVAGTSALGEPGLRAERVGEDAADAAIEVLEGDAPIDRHLADQLLVFLALAGGRLRIPERTDHVEAGIDLLSAFGVGVERDAGPTVVVPESETLSWEG